MLKKILSLCLITAILTAALPNFVFAESAQASYELVYNDMTTNVTRFGGGYFDAEETKLITATEDSDPVDIYYQHTCSAAGTTGIRMSNSFQVSEGDIILASYWINAQYASSSPKVQAYMQYTKDNNQGGDRIYEGGDAATVQLDSGKWYRRHIICQADRTTTGLTTGANTGFRFVLDCGINAGQVTKLGDLEIYRFASDFEFGGKTGADAVEAYVGDAKLLSIENNGTPIADFDADTLNYYLPEDEYGTVTATAAGMFGDVSIDSSDESKTVITVKAYPTALGSKTEYGKETKNVYTVIKGEPSSSDSEDVLSSLVPADTMNSMVFFGADFYDREKSIKEVDLSGEDAPIDTAMKYAGKGDGNSVGGGIRGNSVDFKASEAGSYVLISYWVKAEITDSTSTKPIISSAMSYIKANGSSNGPGIKDLDGSDRIELPEAGKWYKIYNIFKITDPTSGGDMTSLRFILGCSQYLEQETYFGGYNAYLFTPDYTYGGKESVEESIKALIGNNKLSSITNNDEMIAGFDSDTYEYSIAADALGEIQAQTDEANAEVITDNSDSTKIKITVSQPYCFNDGKPCEYGKMTSRDYIINVATSPFLPPEGGDDEDDSGSDGSFVDEKNDLTPVDTMSSMKFFGSAYYDSAKSESSLDISDNDAPVDTVMKYAGKLDGTTVGGGMRGTNTDFKVAKEGSYVLVTYWVKGEITDGSSTKPMISSKMSYIGSNGSSNNGDIFDIDGVDAIELPEAGKWYKIYNLFKIKEPSTSSEKIAVRFIIGCSKYLSQEIYFGGYNAYLFEPDFSYDGETNPEMAIINYVQDAKANSVSYNGISIEGFESDYYNYAIEADNDVRAGDFTADVHDFSKYSAQISEDGDSAVLTVKSHSFAECNEYGVYPNTGTYTFKLVASSGFSVKSTRLITSDGTSADALNPGNYTLKVSVENKNDIPAKLFAVLYDTLSEKVSSLKIEDVQTSVSDYEFAITVPEGEAYELGVFAADDLESPVPLTSFVSVAKSGEGAIASNPLTTDSLIVKQNMNTYMVDASAAFDSDCTVRTLAIAFEKNSAISENTITYAKVMTTSNDGRLDFSFTPSSDGEYTLFLADGLSGDILKCDFGYYGKASVNESVKWFETATKAEIESVLSSNGTVGGISAEVLLGELYDEVETIDDLSYVASALFGKTYASYEAFAAELAAAVEESLICESFKKADVSALDALIEKYGEKSDINLDETYGYNAFDSAQKKSIVKAVKETDYASSDELYEIINEAIMLEVFNSFSWGNLEGALEFFEEDADIDMSGFNKLSSSQKTAVLKGMSAASFDSADDIPDKLAGLVSDLKSTGSSGTGGGGSKSSSGYDSFFSTDAAVTTPSQSETTNTPAAKFADVPATHWANPYVEDLSNKGIVSGDGNGLFYPERNLTRAEYVKMAVLAFGLYDANAESEFADCQSGAWYDSYVASGVNAGIISGMGDGNFAPDAFITRQDMAVIAQRCLAISGRTAALPDSDKFTDDALIADYALDAVYSMKAMNIINGMGDGSFSPVSNATRAMASKVIDLLMQA